MKANVLVHGFGTIGKRISYSINLQKDMNLVGIVNRSINTNIQSMLGEKGPLKANIYATNEEKLKEMEKSEFEVKGTLEDILSSKKVDVVIDCTPAGIEKQYKKLYEKYGVKAIFQGGASPEVADLSFNADFNYEKALNKNSLRVVSCNTTSLIRTLNSLKDFGIHEVYAFLVRRAVDPPDDHKGPVDAIIPVTEIPSHHGPDVRTVMPKLDITTMAAKVPVTKDHNHFVTAKLNKQISKEEVIEKFRKANRILLFKANKGYTSTAIIEEYFRDINRPRGDMYEVALWEDSITLKNRTRGVRVYWTHAVHSEAVVIPENIDAVRAITGIEKNKKKSIEKTNKSLGI